MGFVKTYPTELLLFETSTITANLTVDVRLDGVLADPALGLLSHVVGVAAAWQVTAAEG